MSSANNNIATEEFLLFLRGMFKNMIIHNSNVFFRDLHYGVMAFLGSKGSKTGHHDAEKVARELAARLVSEGIFTGIDHQSWRVNYPKFALPRVEKAAPAKPAAPASTPTAAAPAAAPGAPTVIPAK